MGIETLIEWCDRTWSPHFGCVKVSAGCKNCHAEQGSKRNPGLLGVWGPNGTRRAAAESSWVKLQKWDREAIAAGRRFSVFPSLCDPFEDWQGPMVDSQRRELSINDSDFVWPTGWPSLGNGDDWGEREYTMTDVRLRFGRAIRSTPNLDYLLLTKRPENAGRMLVEMFGSDRRKWPRNFRVGTSVENQATADERLPHLMRLDWPNFVSAEPLLGPVDFASWLWGKSKVCSDCPRDIDCVCGFEPSGAIHHIIVGGESGPNARLMDEAWGATHSRWLPRRGRSFLLQAKTRRQEKDHPP